MRSAGKAARFEEKNTHTTFLSEDLKELYHLGGLNVDGRLILKRILKKYGMTIWTVAGSCGHSVAQLGSTRGGQFVDQLSDCQLHEQISLFDPRTFRMQAT
jgi:hypothetical protein